MTKQEIQLRVLKLLENNPHMSQRQISKELGVSLGKAHYVVKALINLGWLKLDNFCRSDNKLGYAYILTPKGIAEKSALTVRFLEYKQAEYKQLRQDIKSLKSQIEKF